MRRYYRFANLANKSGTAPVEGTIVTVSEPPVVPEKPKRTYPNGDPIPDTLPESYQISQECGSCAAYKPLSKLCSMYGAPVIVNYWCSSFTKIEETV